MPVTLVMLEAIRDFERATGRQVGMKPAGGIRTAKEAIQYLVILYETLGPRWMSPDWFRFGASSLLNDVLMQIEFQRTGPLPGPRPLHDRLTSAVTPAEAGVTESLRRAAQGVEAGASNEGAGGHRRDDRLPGSAHRPSRRATWARCRRP